MDIFQIPTKKYLIQFKVDILFKAKALYVEYTVEICKLPQNFH